MNSSSSRGLWLLAPVAAALLVAGCASTEGVAPSNARLRDAASLGLSESQAAAEVAPVEPQWWRALGDAQLDQLVEQALQGSPNLRVAQARVARALAAADGVDAASGPQLNGQFDATHQRFTGKGMVPAPLAGSIQDTATLQLNGSWEIDFFGRHRAALDAALGSAQAAQAEAAAARTLLATNVVRGYVQLARLQEQRDLAQRALDQRQGMLDLVNQRVSAGLDGVLEQRQSEGAVPEARQQIEAINEQIALTRHALAALVGQPTQDPAPQAPRLAGLRPLPEPQALPTDLLGRRADIAAARWRVEASRGEVANARAQFYPNLNLVAYVGLSSIGLDELLTSGAKQWGIGPAVRLPIFDGGRLRANLSGKNADLDAAVESYNAAVIDAVHEVADQLASARSVALQRAQQQQALQSAESAYAIAEQRYRAGLSNHLQLLSAETAVLAQRRLDVDLRTRALQAQVNLAQALGGGWRDTAGATDTHAAHAAIPTRTVAERP
ncbi:MAG TPA: efflux transporter outer membrane subunit [Hydrogenophaga sp.]|uniref:efflux transporter outer membrane subunit n=1 Tax=Hydrogenophaga sp. TaxID=1904254 RepID=UPI002CE9662B|nr:efflux transporter outer membrane subunit [Hydrogenophaga sp.]HSX93673.1 efflux transporter outer membrane subunit [Hydrogenophaga sp.]